MLGGYWIVAKTKSKRERWAAENVKRQGFDCYLPLTTEALPNTGGVRAFCLFPGYLFVFTRGQWRALLSTFGVTDLIMSGQQPAVMPDKEIDNLRAREDEKGFIQLPKMRRLQAGDAVRVTGGTFADSRGIYECDSSGQRVRVLLDFMGRRTPFLIGEEFIEAVE